MEEDTHGDCRKWPAEALPAVVRLLPETCESRRKLLQRQCAVKLAIMKAKFTWAKVH
jgi:hypothetical protein